MTSLNSPSRNNRLLLLQLQRRLLLLPLLLLPLLPLLYCRLLRQRSWQLTLFFIAFIGVFFFNAALLALAKVDSNWTPAAVAVAIEVAAAKSRERSVGVAPLTAIGCPAGNRTTRWR